MEQSILRLKLQAILILSSLSSLSDAYIPLEEKVERTIGAPTMLTKKLKSSSKFKSASLLPARHDNELSGREGVI